MDRIVNMMFDNAAKNVENYEVCPVCGSRVRFFYMALDEKILMCENIKCDFPFGYEEFKIIKEEDEPGFEMSQGSTSTSTSLRSWSDVDRISYDPENSSNKGKQFNGFHEKSNIQIIEEKIANEKRIVKDLNALKGLTKKFSESEEESGDIIKNKKLLKKLMKLQNLSGVRLVKQEEMEVIKLDRPAYKGDELKIDIDRSGSSLCAIKIEIAQKQDYNTTVPNVT